MCSPANSTLILTADETKDFGYKCPPGYTHTGGSAGFAGMGTIKFTCTADNETYETKLKCAVGTQSDPKYRCRTTCKANGRAFVQQYCTELYQKEIDRLHAAIEQNKSTKNPYADSPFEALKNLQSQLTTQYEKDIETHHSLYKTYCGCFEPVAQDLQKLERDIPRHCWYKPCRDSVFYQQFQDELAACNITYVNCDIVNPVINSVNSNLMTSEFFKNDCSAKVQTERNTGIASVPEVKPTTSQPSNAQTTNFVDQTKNTLVNDKTKLYLAVGGASLLLLLFLIAVFK